MAEHRFCKPTVVGSTPTLGSSNLSTKTPVGVPNGRSVCLDDSPTDSHGLAAEHRLHLVGRLSLELGDDMGVGIHRQGDGRVTEHLHDDAGVHSVGKQEACSAVAQVVEAHTREADCRQ